MKKAFLFPGQGSQFIGMGQDLANEFQAAREVFSEVDDALGEKLSMLIFQGDIKELTLTKNAQPAIMAVSIAVLRVMSANGLDLKSIDLFAGHSLGEYSALCASDVISLKDTSLILRKRGLAMQKAVPEGQGSMVAVIGMTSKTINELILTSKCNSELIQIANDNDPSQVVISGQRKEMQKFIEFLKQKKPKRIIDLPVSAPFHSRLMEPAALTMEAELKKVDLSIPIVPIIQNVDLSVLSSTDGLVGRLVKQICATVRWRESLIKMADTFGVKKFFEIGPGKVLAGTVKRTIPESNILSVGLATQIDEAL
ncbi:ACP S-malonyltransferase, partial [Paracoccaceae bacterium]|nr:ACP S-malonyltransferase [Paracoccaceae bacterium]